MSALPTFSKFFEALWDREPFTWQTMLAERLVDGRWPQALDLPTASGKTACMDAAIYALACQSERPTAERTAPRRIWFVVDRRIVVDEAFDRAEAIAKKLREATEVPLKNIADRLRIVSGTDRPLATAKLRGGILRDDRWARIPSQPAVITSTVDQLGSRLLFRGYAHSRLAAPIFAGLAANDSLILLDEAHCSVPFLQTLRTVEEYRGEKWAEAPLRLPFAFAILSATLPEDEDLHDVFPGAEREKALDHPVLRQRMRASKPAELIRVKSTKLSDALVKEAVARAQGFVEKTRTRRVAVIVNRVKTAFEIASQLHQQAGETYEVALLTGRLRPYERDRIVKRWTPKLRASGPEEPAKPIVLVSTQCIEVGADFSFDAMVTEAGPLDALRQRFGRLNRMGSFDTTPSAILVREADTDLDKVAKSPDPVYGEAIPQCWTLLEELAEAGEREEARFVDFGIEALDRKLSEVEQQRLELCLTPRDVAPALLPAHVDLLCQTAPAPAVEPDVSLYLHGIDRGAPEARVVWRADLTPDDPRAWIETVTLCPPLSGEMLSVPLWRLRAWLQEGATTSVADGPDIEGVDDSLQEQDTGRVVRPALVWRGRDRSRVARHDREIGSDDVVIVPASYRIEGLGQRDLEEEHGLGADRLDIWEACLPESGKALAIRLNRRALAPWSGHTGVVELLEAAAAKEADEDRFWAAVDALAIRQADAEVLDDEAGPPRWWRKLLGDIGRTPRAEEHPGGGLILVSRKKNERLAESDLFADDDDLLSESDEEVPLERHTLAVEGAVEKIASRCLPDELRPILLEAALWHDVGKADERFQLLLHNGDELAAAGGDLLAKSRFVPMSRAQRTRVRAVAELPEHFRHETLSMQLAERQSARRAGTWAGDLLLHLIASHHGHARPFAQVCEDSNPRTVLLDHCGRRIELSDEERVALRPAHRADSGVSERFWRLTRRYGWWGLAYLEAVLRLGDWYASEHDPPPPDYLTGPSMREPERPAQSASATREVALSGLDGANPLGFLAALGTMAALSRDDASSVRLLWVRGATWTPVVSGAIETDPTAFSEIVASALRGAEVSAEAERVRAELEAVHLDARRRLRDKTEEIRARGLRGKEREAARLNEEAPLKSEEGQARAAWLSALRHAVPSPELALGKQINCTPEEFRKDYARPFIQEAGLAHREAVDLLGAFATDACADRDKVVATPFCFITGSGHQYFLDTVRQLMDKASPQLVEAALFRPWTYEDKKLSMRWDPFEDRRYALMDRDPTASDNKSRTVWMANLLAYRALVLFFSAPSSGRLVTTGWSWDRKIPRFTWPIWTKPLDLDSIRSLLLVEDLQKPEVSSDVRRARGIGVAFRADRIQVGNPPLHKINFSLAREV